MVCVPKLNTKNTLRCDLLFIVLIQVVVPFINKLSQTSQKGLADIWHSP
ncbi:MAG: hypothetical protein ACJAYH_000246 [Celeribacter sp.]|jgi:hypothetical protein